MINNDSLVYFQERPFLHFLALCLSACTLFYFCRFYFARIVNSIVTRMPVIWTKILCSKTLTIISWLIPVLFVHISCKSLVGIPEWLEILIHRSTLVLLVILTISAITVSLGKFNEAYNGLEISKNRPIKGIIQIISLILYCLAFILIISIVLDKSPWFFLSGLGAATAILLLVFKDTILSLVAGIQITSNNLIKIGDWIEMPQFSADGDVIDIALHSVRVQNWDKTITVIPTHKFLENSFKNWRGMQEFGGRRIKRSIFIDQSSIRFLEENEIENFSNFRLLKDYINDKRTELKEYNAQFNNELIVNSRRLTNIGTFRAYLSHYLAQHPMVHPNMTQMVRQLAPTENGLPLEIYVFIKDIRWGFYEQAQADIFDHIISISSEFGLRIHQSPTGFDFRNFKT